MDLNSANKIIRTVCLFKKNPGDSVGAEIEKLSERLTVNGFIVQTKRLCSPIGIGNLNERVKNSDLYLSVGTLKPEDARSQLNDFFQENNTSFNVELANNPLEESVTDILFKIIKSRPEKTFNFAYVFNNVASSPYFPSSAYASDGFSIGLQPTDLAYGCGSLEEWFGRMLAVWEEITRIFKDDSSFLGIDSSVAPLFEGKSSLINFIKKLHGVFVDSINTDTYLKITEFIKTQNPKPVGLCGLMFPCLEDFELAEEYEQGNFNIERNTFLSLQSGLGIDTYPIAINERPRKILEILSLLQKLSNKYKKPLSARFVSDGKAITGEKTDFKNQYLKDVFLRSL